MTRRLQKKPPPRRCFRRPGTGPQYPRLLISGTNKPQQTANNLTRRILRQLLEIRMAHQQNQRRSVTIRIQQRTQSPSLRWSTGAEEEEEE
jgi:hypothetical protein